MDTASKSPHKQWIHLHTFKDGSEGETTMSDKVLYRFSLEPLGDLVHWHLKCELKYIFDYR